MSVVGQSNAFAPITPNDHRGPVWIVALTGLFSTLLTLVFRFWSKRTTLSIDDYAIAVCTAFGIIQSGVLFAGLQNGLGRSFDLTGPVQRVAAGKDFIASMSLYILTVGTSKVALALSARRILSANMQKLRMTTMSVIAFSIFWILGGIFGVSIQCAPQSILTTEVYERCPNQAVRWSVIATTDGLLELSLFAVPVMTVWSLQMKRHLKATIMVSFGARIFCIILSALHGRYHGAGLKSVNPGVSLADVLALEEIHMNYAIMSASLPSLNGFLMNFHTDEMMRVGQQNRTYPSSRDKHTFELQDFSRSIANSTMRSQREAFGYSVSVARPEREGSIGSRMSQDPIIKHTVSYDITYEDAMTGDGESIPSTRAGVTPHAIPL